MKPGKKRSINLSSRIMLSSHFPSPYAATLFVHSTLPVHLPLFKGEGIRVSLSMSSSPMLLLPAEIVAVRGLVSFHVDSSSFIASAEPIVSSRWRGSRQFAPGRRFEGPPVALGEERRRWLPLCRWLGGERGKEEAGEERLVGVIVEVAMVVKECKLGRRDISSDPRGRSFGGVGGEAAFT